MIRICLAGHKGSIHTNAFTTWTHAHVHTHIADKGNFKKPIAYQFNYVHIYPYTNKQVCYMSVADLY